MNELTESKEMKEINHEPKRKLVNQDHPYWHSVYARLFPLYNKKKCNGNYEIVESILMSLPNVDINGTIEFYKENGGYCDCEVFYNVYQDVLEPELSGC